MEEDLSLLIRKNSQIEKVVSDTSGIFYAYARKEGYKDSREIKIKIYGEKLKGDHVMAVYWKNGEPIDLTYGNHDAEAISVFITDNGNVYIAGWVQPVK